MATQVHSEPRTPTTDTLSKDNGKSNVFFSGQLFQPPPLSGYEQDNRGGARNNMIEINTE